MIGTTNTKSTKATSKKARKISDQNANEQLLASEVSVVSTDKGKDLKQLGGKKKKKGRRKNGKSRLLKNLLQTLLGKGNPLRGVSYM